MASDGTVGGMAGIGAFGAGGRYGASFLVGGGAIPAAGSVLGADYDAGWYSSLRWVRPNPLVLTMQPKHH